MDYFNELLAIRIKLIFRKVNQIGLLWSTMVHSQSRRYAGMKSNMISKSTSDNLYVIISSFLSVLSLFESKMKKNTRKLDNSLVLVLEGQILDGATNTP